MRFLIVSSDNERENISLENCRMVGRILRDSLKRQKIENVQSIKSLNLSGRKEAVLNINLENDRLVKWLRKVESSCNQKHFKKHQ